MWAEFWYKVMKCKVRLLNSTFPPDRYENLSLNIINIDWNYTCDHDEFYLAALVVIMVGEVIPDS